MYERWEVIDNMDGGKVMETFPHSDLAMRFCQELEDYLTIYDESSKGIERCLIQ